ncbi:MAG: DUF3043 domain-containing protein [Actinomycetota bacterium]|nr:MAG: DUF3043 domain-containing protein [Actinomycetota bacterium]
MFKRRTPEPEAPVSEATVDPSRAAKGRPTPSRKEAEAARRHAIKVPADPKAARRAARERDRAARVAARAALAAGDERALPARDRGPVRAFARDFVDSRRTLAEFFIILAVVVLVLNFIRLPGLQAFVTLIWFVMTAVIVIDTAILLFRMSRAMKAQWPDPKDRKGTLLYAGMRCLQFRRLRLPPPRFRPGGRPVEPRTR